MAEILRERVASDGYDVDVLLADGTQVTVHFHGDGILARPKDLQAACDEFAARQAEIVPEEPPKDETQALREENTSLKADLADAQAQLSVVSDALDLANASLVAVGVEVVDVRPVEVTSDKYLLLPGK